MGISGDASTQKNSANKNNMSETISAKPKKADKTPFFSRELSWLDFNYRVLEEAMDKSMPMLERIKFLAIFSSNLDEFFMVRVGGLKDQILVNYSKKDPAGLTPIDQFEAISRKAHEYVRKQYSIWSKSIKPQLSKRGIKFFKWNQLSDDNVLAFTQYFDETIYPVITPMAYDSGRPLPILFNKRIYFFVILRKDTKTFFSFVQVPLNLPRYIPIDEKSENSFIMIEDIIRANIQKLYKGYRIESAMLFRFTRSADLTLDEEGAEDLLHAIEKYLKKRKTGYVVRVEMEKGFTKEGINFFRNIYDVEDDDLYELSGPLDLTFLFSLAGIAGFSDMKNIPFKSQPNMKVAEADDIFQLIKDGDILVHHPYDSFDAVIKFLNQAAFDPDVLSIKQTLYRVSGDSPVIKGLINAAHNGKNVTVLVELKARFDEEANINWARELEESGCHVIYGLVGLKTHCKALLVIRKEAGRIKRYCHLGTGNYNDKTAGLYTDMGMFTANEDICSDVSEVFNVITGYSSPQYWRKLSIAPINIRETFNQMIDEEIKLSSKNNPGHIIAKMNSLVDKDIIKMLYKASQNNVKVDLIVRGICCLVPGVPGISENINVISIVGKYLEHSRIYYFKHGHSSKMFLSSADWMPRNLNRRIEILFPVENQSLKETIIDILNTSLSDNQKCRILKSDGKYVRNMQDAAEKINSQQIFEQRALSSQDKGEIKIEDEILSRPRRTING